MMDEDSQCIDSSFDESYDSNYVPETPDSAAQTIPDYYDLSIPESPQHTIHTTSDSLDMEVVMEMEIQSDVESRIITSMEVSYYDNVSYNQAQESLMDVSYYTDSNSRANTTNSVANSTGKDILKYMYVDLCKCQMLIVAFCYVVLLCKSTCIHLSYRFTRDTPTWWCRCRAAKGQTTRDTVIWGWYQSFQRHHHHLQYHHQIWHQYPAPHQLQ